MKKYICLLLFMTIFIGFKVKALDNLKTKIESNYGILYDVTDDMVLFDKQSNSRIKIASMTKIMTAIVAIENIQDLDQQVVITDNDYKNVYQENLTVVGFNIGESVTYRDLLYGLLFKSGADAAYALADNIAGNEQKFVKMMNEKVKDLELKNTKFSNCVGYDEESNYSSVYDTALFFKYALNNEFFKQIISTDKYTTTNGRFTLQNVATEQIEKVGIESPYNSYILGGKTGYTEQARNCLATFATYNDTTYIVVVANASTHNPIKDSVNLYTEAFNNYSRKKVVGVDDYLVSLSYNKDEVKVYADKEIDILLPNDASINDINMKYEGDSITNNSKIDDKLGIVNVEYNGEVIKTLDIVFNDKIKSSVNYQVVKANTNRINRKTLLFIGLSSVGGIIILFAFILFISMYIDVKKNKRRWKF